MKNVHLFLAVAFFCSCGNSNIEDQGDYYELSLDTVYLDSKGENLFLFNNLSVSDFSDDQTLMYNFDLRTPSIEVLDLDKMEFKERILLEKEGPDGVGEMVYHFNLLGSDTFFAGSTDQKFGIFSIDGSKVKGFTEEELGEVLGFPQGMVSISQVLALSSDPLSVICEFNDWTAKDGTKRQWIGVWHVDEGSIEEYKIENWFDFDGYSPLVDFGNYKAQLNAYWFFIESLDEKVLFSTNVTSTLLAYKNGAFDLIIINHKTIENKKRGKLTDRFESREEFELELKKLRSEINFSKPVWDAENEVFYRFAYKEKGNEDQSAPSAEVYLVVMNKEFEVLHEIKVPQLNKSPNFHFVKDGRIWIFENVDDEVSFIRIKVSA
ncbi:DUF4221 family protein [Arthrospiribacter ruber]|uniref:DUF4221 domain-containing protein n=1 Tax=Arthrospiribacter ruber TaxID=2487934 RepID=A0A951IVA3_9BACT|nr:DUF4221 family protein [Arthrospiribacter ruber]MBW3467790.1 DUF4221 domain-containing protein [Arthrospiribacter ruber]